MLLLRGSVVLCADRVHFGDQLFQRSVFAAPVLKHVHALVLQDGAFQHHGQAELGQQAFTVKGLIIKGREL